MSSSQIFFKPDTLGDAQCSYFQIERPSGKKLRIEVVTPSELVNQSYLQINYISVGGFQTYVKVNLSSEFLQHVLDVNDFSSSNIIEIWLFNDNNERLDCKNVIFKRRFE